MRIGRIILILIVAAVIGTAAYVALNPEVLDQFKKTKTITDEEQIAKMALAWVGAPFSDDYSVLRVPGWVDNMSKQKMRALTLEIQLLDEKGAKKEKITYEVNDIPPSSRKTFDINAGTIPADYTAEITITKVEVIQ